MRQYHRFASPECPNRGTNPTHTLDRMKRAYLRTGKSRGYKGIGWYCEECERLFTDAEANPS
jgi:hypothetical protein